MATNYRQRYAIQKKNEQRILAVNPSVPDSSGIYFLTRTDENEIRFAYIGQALHLKQRLANHLSGFQQHIDKSLKKHGLYSEDNKYGWKVNFITCPKESLDELEEKYITEYAKSGYQLRNKTRGRQGEGKEQIDEYRPAKGYRDGVRYGEIKLAREIKTIIDKHLVVSIKEEKKNNKISQKALAKFNELLDIDFYKEGK